MAKTTDTDGAKIENQAGDSVESKSAGEAAASSTQSKADPKADQKTADDSLSHDAQPRELSLRTFLRICGEQPDQTAGFARFAELNKPGRFTIQDWKDALKSFKSTPVR